MPPADKNKHYDLMTYRAPIFRAALAILEKASCSELDNSGLIECSGTENFVSFLNQNGLSNIFYNFLSSHSGQLRQEQAIKQVLRPHSLNNAAKYLSQQATLKKIHNAFEATSINYVVFKGAHVRENAYEEAWIRPTADIDVLVADSDKKAAIDALESAGMQCHPNPEVLSHEVTLSNADTSVDLHWHIMRPGRTRIDMTELLKEDAVFSNGYWGMNPTATLFVLLTHPAINKYVCSPDASLIKIIDLCLWLKHPGIDQTKLLSLINRAGMKTAAWSTLLLVNLLTNDVKHQSLSKKLQPGYLKRKYIQFWVSKDLPTRYYDNRFLMRTAFSLSLHDNVADMMRAVAQLTGYKLRSR